MLRSIVSTSIAAALISVASMSGAYASPIFNPTSSGDPFPTGSTDNLTGGPYQTPFGSFSSLIISNFNLGSITSSGGNQIFTYIGPTLTHFFYNPFSVVSFTSGTFEVAVLGRSGFGLMGTFTAELLAASFSGTIAGQSVTASISSPSFGTAIYQLDGSGNLEVSATWPNLNTGYSVNGGPFQSTPLTGNSAGPLATPIPAALPLFGSIVGFAGLWMRRRKVCAPCVRA